jgi:hypothetical protein
MGRAQANAGANLAGAAGATLGGIAASPADVEAQRALDTGAAEGEQLGREAALGGTQQALQAARTSGLNKGQAALTAGQQAGNLYTEGRQAGTQMGTQAYQTAQDQRIGAAGGQAAAGGVQANAGGTIGGIGTAARGQGAAETSTLMGGIGGIASAGLGLLSDRRAKVGIEGADTLDEAAQTIEPKKYAYRGDGTERTGVIAQDVEKVNPENVVETPEGKAIDVAAQTGTNAARISEAGRRIAELEKIVKGRKYV